MFNSSPSKYWLKSTISMQAGKTLLKHLSSAAKWHDLTLFLNITVHISSKGKAILFLLLKIILSAVRWFNRFFLAAWAVLARQSCPVSSAPRVRAIPIQQEGMQPTRAWGDFSFYFFFWLCVGLFFFSFWQTSLSIWDGCERVFSPHAKQPTKHNRLHQLRLFNSWMAAEC